VFMPRSTLRQFRVVLPLMGVGGVSVGQAFVDPRPVRKLF